jgi:glycosyltransferase involved in cell wall biosynthesis
MPAGGFQAGGNSGVGMALISIVTPCYNEADNVGEFYRRVKAVFSKIPEVTGEHIFIDNASTDGTVAILKEIAHQDAAVKIIVNTRNFGHIRSPFHALLLTQGDASAFLAADLQEPPELLAAMIKKWQEGFKIVTAIKTNSDESRIMFFIRSQYYKLVKNLSDVTLIHNFNGYGLYDRRVIEILRKLEDPYPYFRGLICEIGFERAEVGYTQTIRKKGKTKSNFLILFDIAMLGIISHSKIPLRIATIAGFILSMFSVLTAAGYFVYKVIFWDSFSIGIAPLLIGFFFFTSVQLFFIGIIGEYLGVTYTHVLNRPLVVEKERINFPENG